MKKILILMIVLVMALSAMPISATESIPMEVANPDIEVLTSFASCTNPGCGGTVVLSCSDRMASDTDMAAFACNIYEHNKYGACNHYYVKYFNNGYCNKCMAPLSYLIEIHNFPARYAFHIHAYRHVFLTSNGTYKTEIWSSCNI